MAFKFRFPAAILHYVKEGQYGLNDVQTLENAVERAREWATPLEGEKRKRPSLNETAEWVNRVIALSREQEQEARQNG